MFTITRLHRNFATGFLLAWALSHAAGVSAQNDSKDKKPVVGDKIRKTLDQVIALDYAGQSFSEAIQHLRDRTQLPIVLDQIALQQLGLIDGMPFNIEMRNVGGKVRSALQHLLGTFNLTYVILEDCMLITTEETAVARQMRQRVPIDLTDIPATKALRQVARQAGVSLVIDPRVVKAAGQNVTLQLEDVSVETSLRLVAELVDLKAVRMGNVVFVTDDARLRFVPKRIRYRRMVVS